MKNTKKQKPIVVTAPSLTPEEIVKKFRIPKKKVKEIEEMVEKIIANSKNKRGRK